MALRPSAVPAQFPSSLHRLRIRVFRFGSRQQHAKICRPRNTRIPNTRVSRTPATDQAIRVRLAQGRARFNQMYHIWIDENLTVDSKVRMYKTSIAMVARHGSEAWDLTPANLKMIRAWNTGCLGLI